MRKFSDITSKRLLHYVYIIQAGKDYQSKELGEVKAGRVVYVGEGKNNRAFGHKHEDWYKDGECFVELVAYQLTKETAQHVESALISTFGFENLENKRAGRQSQKKLSTKGVQNLFDIIPLVLNEKDLGHTLLVIYDSGIKRETENLYESVTRWWRVNEKKAKKITTIIAMDKTSRKVKAVVENINTVTQNSDNESRYAFDNATKSLSLDSKYMDKWADHLRSTSMNPVQYL